MRIAGGHAQAAETNAFQWQGRPLIPRLVRQALPYAFIRRLPIWRGGFRDDAPRGCELHGQRGVSVRVEECVFGCRRDA